jgi:hypothetical protein
MLVRRDRKLPNQVSRSRSEEIHPAIFASPTSDNPSSLAAAVLVSTIPIKEFLASNFSVLVHRIWTEFVFGRTRMVQAVIVQSHQL